MFHLVSGNFLMLYDLFLAITEQVSIFSIKKMRWSNLPRVTCHLVEGGLGKMRGVGIFPRSLFRTRGKQSSRTFSADPEISLTIPLSLIFNTFPISYRRLSCVAWVQLPFGKASGKQVPAHRTSTHG